MQHISFTHILVIMMFRMQHSPFQKKKKNLITYAMSTF